MCAVEVASERCCRSGLAFEFADSGVCAVEVASERCCRSELAFEFADSGVGGIEVVGGACVGELAFEFADSCVCRIEVSHLLAAQWGVTVGHDGLGLRNPLVAVDAALERGQRVVDDLGFLIGQRSNLLPGLDAVLVEGSFELGADTLDDLEIVDVVRLDAWGAEAGRADHPGSRRPRCGSPNVGFAGRRGFGVFVIEALFELDDAGSGTSQIAFELTDTGIGAVEFATQAVSLGRVRKLALEFADASVCAIEVALKPGLASELRFEFADTGVSPIEVATQTIGFSRVGELALEFADSGVGGIEVVGGACVGELAFEFVDAGVCRLQICHLRFSERCVAIGHDGLSLRNPLVAVDAALERCERPVHGFRFVVGQRSELLVGLDPVLVEGSLELRSHALDRLQVVDVVRLDARRAEAGRADHPGSRRPRCGSHDIGFAGCSRLGVFVVEALFELHDAGSGASEISFELTDTGIGCIEIPGQVWRRVDLAFEFGDAGVCGIEVAAQRTRVRLE